MSSRTDNFIFTDILNTNRVPFSSRSLLLLLYLPFGLLVLLFRLCLIPQALVIMLIIPDGSIKRFLLWIFFTIMGLVVLNKNFERRSITSRMLIANRVSCVDYIPLHIAMDCTTSSIAGAKPLLSIFFYHHTFPSCDTKDISSKLKKIPEFDDYASIPDSVAIPFIAQPEPQPNNGRGLLKFDVWPFTAENIIQPITVSTWRPLDINLTTIDSSEISDLLWILFCPFTIFIFQMLPVIESRDDISIEQFANKTQNQIATSLQIPSTKMTAEDIKTWRNSITQTLPSNELRVNTATGPIISESDFSSVRASPEIDKMVQQVVAVLPDAPVQAVRKDLLETRSVDVTLTKFLDGRLVANPHIDAPHHSIPTLKGTTFSLQDCHSLYTSRKIVIIKESRRRYMSRHGMLNLKQT